MKRMLTVLIVLAFITTCVQAQDRIIGEKGVIGEKGIVGEKSSGEVAIAKSNAQVETAFAEYIRKREEFEKSVNNLQSRLDEGIKLLETHKRFRNPKQGLALRKSWKEAIKLLEDADKKMKVVKAGVVAPDMIQ